VILTTYGTMLRDIELLREIQFHHVILDESQAIKNPLAQERQGSTPAERRNHRLCMTGTPVENNTFELWSQFAFLNPGLLGNMDYFKREFANPIESGGDEERPPTCCKTGLPVHPAPHQGTGGARTAAAHRTRHLHGPGSLPRKRSTPRPASVTAPNCWA
jgi:SNF2 family DNA or RNA helicase